MHITIVAVGQKLPAWAQTAVDDYLARFPRDFTVIVKEVKAEARTGGKPVAQVMAAEAERIERAVPAGDILVAMDEHGRDMTTVDFSKKISGWKTRAAASPSSSAARRSRSGAQSQIAHDAAAVFDDATARVCPSSADRADLSRLVDSCQSPLSPRLNHARFVPCEQKSSPPGDSRRHGDFRH